MAFHARDGSYKQEIRLTQELRKGLGPDIAKRVSGHRFDDSFDEKSGRRQRFKDGAQRAASVQG
jgi:hypothetical protein